MYSVELSIVDHLKRETAVQHALKDKEKLQPQGCVPLHDKEAAVYFHFCPDLYCKVYKKPQLKLHSKVIFVSS